MKYVIAVAAILVTAVLYGFNKVEQNTTPKLDYKVIAAHSTDTLQKRVVVELKKGFKPTGGVTFVNGIFYQAVVSE